MKGDLIRAFFNKVAHDSEYHEDEKARHLTGELIGFMDELRTERGWGGDLADEPPEEMGDLDYVIKIYDETISLSIFNQINAIMNEGAIEEME